MNCVPVVPVKKVYVTSVNLCINHAMTSLNILDYNIP